MPRERREMSIPYRRLTCPKCRRVQYFVCSRKSCRCWKDIPNGKRPQQTLRGDGLRCPYCRFTAHIDYWFERELHQNRTMLVAGASLKE